MFGRAEEGADLGFGGRAVGVVGDGGGGVFADFGEGAVELGGAGSGEQGGGVVGADAGGGEDFDATGGALDQLRDQGGAFRGGGLLAGGEDAGDAEVD